MLKLLYLTLSIRMFGPRNSAYAVNLTYSSTNGRHVSREISIEHPSVGLASLAQLSSHSTHFIKNVNLHHRQYFNKNRNINKVN